MASIKEFLVKQFGDSAERIQGIDAAWGGGQPCNEPSFACGDNGLLQTTCGSGKALLSFKPVPGMRGIVYLIYDDSASKDWDRMRAQGLSLSDIGHCRPGESLRLVYSQ